MGRAAGPGLLERWVAANAVAELVGLGGTGTIGYLHLRYAGEAAGVPAVLAAFAVAVGSGAWEATDLTPVEGTSPPAPAPAEPARWGVLLAATGLGLVAGGGRCHADEHGCPRGRDQRLIPGPAAGT